MARICVAHGQPTCSSRSHRSGTCAPGTNRRRSLSVIRLADWCADRSPNSYSTRPAAVARYARGRLQAGWRTGSAARSNWAAGRPAPDGDAQRVDEGERRVSQGGEHGGELAGVDGAAAEGLVAVPLQRACQQLGRGPAASGWRASSSRPSRLLPTPASPDSKTTRNSPAAARASSSSSAAISSRRPTSGSLAVGISLILAPPLAQIKAARGGHRRNGTVHAPTQCADCR